MAKDLDGTIKKMREHYSDQEIAEDIHQNLDAWVKDGYEKSKLQSFSMKARKDPGAVGAGYQAAKRELSKVVSGGAQASINAQQMFGRITGNDELVNTTRQASAALDSEEQAKNAEIERLRTMHPFAVPAGGVLPYALSTGRTSLTGRMTSPPLAYGGVGMAQYGSPEERVQQGASNALSSLGGAAFADASKFAVKPGAPLSDAQNRALSGLQREATAAGTEFRPSAGDLTGSTAIRSLEDTLSQTPMVDGVMAGQKAARQGAMNTVAAKSIGQVADNVDDPVIAKANQFVDNAYKDLRAVKNKSFEISTIVGDAAEAVIRQEGKLGQGADAGLVRRAEDLLRIVRLKSKVNGETADLWRQDLAQYARDASGGVSHRAGELVKAFDESIRLSARQAGIPKVAENLDKAREVLRNVKVLDRPSVRKGGDVKPNSLRNVVENEGAAGSELKAISDYAGAFPEQPVNSRSFGRAAWAGLAGNPITGLPLVGAGAVAGKALDTDWIRSYMRNGLLFDPNLSYGAANVLDPFLRGAGTIGTQNGMTGPVFGK